MKKIIQAAWKRDSLDDQKLTRALLQYRNTPSQRDHLSPAQKLFGHPIQDTLPAHRRAFAPQWQTTAEEAEQRAIHNADQVEHNYNQQARGLPEIGPMWLFKTQSQNCGTSMASSQPSAHIDDTSSRPQLAASWSETAATYDAVSHLHHRQTQLDHLSQSTRALDPHLHLHHGAQLALTQDH